MTNKPTDYSSSGVDYSKMDPVKVFAQQQAADTASNLNRFNMTEISQSRGESAYVWDEGDSYRAFVIEGLGTKNLVADATRKITGKTYYNQIAQDTVAMIVNDLVTVGAKPMVVNAYFGIGSSDWLSDETRYKDLIIGWKNACNLSGAVYGGGETPTLKGIINPQTIDLAGSAIGIINPKDKLITQSKLQDKDSILLIESSGIHANGLSLARTIADNHPNGYSAKLSDGSLYGEALLAPTHIYAKVIENLQNQNINLHYIANITGHGWRKLMRANKEFTYLINNIPQPQPVFDFIQQQGHISDTEMYGNFNMGVGYALFLPTTQVELAQKIISQSGFTSTHAGHIESGPKKVIIEPKNIIFESNTLQVR
ncbi:MAG: AIR synthase-related protein [Candidatus Shapirobacteria bacterium]|nr:AIR synthase-related protein [Candidatus Shapirobacteria bacterium]